MRFLLPSLILATSLAAGTAADDGVAIAIRAAPVPFYAEDAGMLTAGRLRFRAGFHLTADSKGFGGFSGLVISEDGRRLVAISDQGRWLTARLRHAGDGTLRGLEAGRLGELCDDDGAPVAGRYRHDAEEIVELPGRGFLVSFEGHHRAVHYAGPPAGESPAPIGPMELFPFPPAIEAADPNRGMEAIARLRDGRLLIFSEELRNVDGEILAWVGEPGKNDWQALRLPIRQDADFMPTGAASLPTGDVVLLERSYSRQSGTRIRLSLIAAADVVAGARLLPRQLALLLPPITVDNMEAVAAHRGPAGETLIYLLSDDNFNDDQRTLLMQLELLDGPSRASDR